MWCSSPRIFSSGQEVGLLLEFRFSALGQNLTPNDARPDFPYSFLVFTFSVSCFFSPHLFFSHSLLFFLFILSVLHFLSLSHTLIYLLPLNCSSNVMSWHGGLICSVSVPLLTFILSFSQLRSLCNCSQSLPSCCDHFKWPKRLKCENAFVFHHHYLISRKEPQSSRMRSNRLKNWHSRVQGDQFPAISYIFCM